MKTRSFVILALVAVLAWTAAGAQVLRQVTELEGGPSFGVPALNDAGTSVYVNTRTDPFGSNPMHRWQLTGWDSASGLGSMLTEIADGVSWLPRWWEEESPSVSVSDDGAWIAFVSPADLTGQNHDESLEIFVMAPDGSNLSQITNHSGPANTSWVYTLAMAGSGNRIAIIADTDPLGSNPDRRRQLFIVNRDGTGLAQLTSFTAADHETHDDEVSVDISDDGQTIVFASRADPTGENPDGFLRIFLILADGTNLRQVVPGHNPRISGNGLLVAYYANGTAYVIDPWRGTMEFSASSAGAPSITDDGQFVFFEDHRNDPIENPDGNWEIWRGAVNGGALTAITRTTNVDNMRPIVSGNGEWVAFRRYDPSWSSVTLRIINFRGTVENVLSGGLEVDYAAGSDITPDGSRVVYSQNGDIFRVDTDDSAPVQVIDLSSAADQLLEPTITADGETIVFYNEPHVYAIEADGTGLRLLSGGVPDVYMANNPVIAANGSFVVFQGLSTTGPGHDGVYRVRPDGTDLLLIADDLCGRNYPQIDANGVWVVFLSCGDSGVARVRTDGTGLEVISSDSFVITPGARPDISGSGDRIVFASPNDPLGTNPEGNYEIFLYDDTTATTRQLTFSADGRAHRPRISLDGAWVYFHWNFPLFDENPKRSDEPYRVEVATGTVERVGGLRRGPCEFISDYRERLSDIALDETGRRAAFTAYGDWAGTNPDYDLELYLIDQRASGRIEATKTSPTVLSWDTDPRFVRYDVIRGDLANVTSSGDAIDLGPVSCLEEDSPDANTEGFGDPEQPSPGQVLFYLHRGTQGEGDAPRTWGFGTGDLERIPASGACDP